MSQSQYLKMLEREIQKLNKKIDFKIMRGENYRREARDHRLMLRRMRYLRGQTVGQKLVHLFFRKNILTNA
jgi:hypothetical protein